MTPPGLRAGAILHACDPVTLPSATWRSSPRRWGRMSSRRRSSRGAIPAPRGGSIWLTRDVAARAFDEHHRDDAVRIADAMTAARQAGIPVPNPTLVETGVGIWLVTPWIEGDLGARWLDTPERARVVARVMGELAGDIREIDPAFAPLAFVHGDLAPINVVLGADGAVAALLDFEHAGVGDPLTDVAWWGWVVRHHHPDAWVAAWPTFCAAAGADRESDGPALRALMLDELSRRAAAASDDAERARWLERLAEANTW